jgi:hypothetical protein
MRSCSMACAEMMKNIDSICKDHKPNGFDTISNKAESNKQTPLFQKSLKHFATGMVRIEKDDLMHTFDFGLPPNVSCLDRFCDLSYLHICSATTSQLSALTTKS